MATIMYSGILRNLKREASIPFPPPPVPLPLFPLPISLLSSPSPSLPSPYNQDPLNPARGLRERCKLPSGVWGGPS